VQKLKGEYHDGQVAEKFLKELSNSLSEKRYTKVLNDWKKDRDIISKFLLHSDAVNIEVAPYIMQLEKQSSTDIQNFAQNFPLAAKSHGVQIDPNSRHPNYNLMEGFIVVGVNEKKREVSITPRMGKVIVLGPELDQLLITLRSEIERIFERDWDVSRFRDNLIEIYKSTSPRNENSKNPEVLIKVIMKEFKKRYNLNHDEFLVDFSRFLKEDKTIQISNTRDSANGIQIVGSESNGYYGYMKFEVLT
jgi:hypothetical protein